MKTLSPKHRPKIAKPMIKGINGYNWDNGEQAFGHREQRKKKEEQQNS